MKKIVKTIVILSVILLTSCSSNIQSSSENKPYSAKEPVSIPFPTWNGLQLISTSQLKVMETNEQDPEKKAWIKLALINKQNNGNTQKLSRELLAWREQNPLHPGNDIMPNSDVLTQLGNGSSPQKIALLLPQTGAYASAGNVVREGFLNAYYANVAKVGKQNVRFYDTQQTKDMTALYQQAVMDGADFIIGPLVKDNVQSLAIVPNLSAPVLALNYSNANKQTHNLYEFGLLPEDEARQIADRAKRDGFSNALVIAPQSAWGQRVVQAFREHWQSIGGNIKQTLIFNPSQVSQIAASTGKISGQDFDVVFLFSQPLAARTIVPLIKKSRVKPVAIYATSSVYSGKPNPMRDADLNGIVICDIPWIINIAHGKAGTTSEAETDRLYAVGQDAYLLSQAMERLVKLPNFPLYGTTGALTMSEQQIHRRLPCKVIKDGLV